MVCKKINRSLANMNGKCFLTLQGVVCKCNWINRKSMLGDRGASRFFESLTSPISFDIIYITWNNKDEYKN